MEIYKDYLNLIKDAVKKDSSSQFESKHFFSKADRINDLITLNSRYSDYHIAPSLSKLAGTLHKDLDFNQKLGLHPSFKQLKSNGKTEEHYIVSVFIDIKGSTNLFKRFDKETIHVIVEAILKAGIHTALIFNGYVHRLQGDGMFLYFGGKEINKKSAVNQALQMVSVYSYFIQNDLKEYFKSKGIEGIFVRSGIDLGKDEDVLWAKSGIGEISEVTTCSLHTSLASKMQSHAKSNGVVVGDFVVDEIEIEELFNPVCKRTRNDNDRYIFQIPEKQFRYTQYDFDWEKFLKRQRFIALDRFGLPVLKFQDKNLEHKELLEPIARESKPYFSNEK
jgi:class 3 adenylate cyclase|tara:strand:- start:835 stop:1836 length:1002 start_codon:yes stop_codon:yes gene_type:complete